MPEIVIGQTPILSHFHLALRLYFAIKNRRPLSLIRVGDGDGHALGFEDTTSREEIDRILGKWFGDNKISDDDVRDIQRMLKDAIADADILGVPDRLNHAEQWRRVPKVISRYGLWDGVAPLCSAEAHIHLHQSDLYGIFLRGLDWLGIITCRDVEKRISAHWGIAHVERYNIPEEFHYATHKHSVKRHYPDRFDELMANLRVPFRGAPFLVGGGVLGKIYCHRIKELGGIAIDIGSVFDCWARKNSRGSVKKMRLGL